jgi:hypothetical protein
MEELDLRKMCAKTVSKVLTQDQKIKSIFAMPFLNKLLNIEVFEQCSIHDESQVFQYDPITK